MVTRQDFNSPERPTWCPGCGNFGILNAIKMALAEQDIAPHEIVIVTGSTQGIGQAIARACVSWGARVVVHGRDEKLGQEAVAELGEAKAALLIGDLADSRTPQRLVDFAVERFGGLTSVVNNAAYVASGNIHTTDDALFRRVFEINTLAPYLLVQAALPHLRIP